jgi:TRAP-type C4-dicarboxylate transport system permease small subunit
MLIRIMDKFIYHSTALIFISAALIAFIQVISRYVFNSSLSWAEEALRYLFIWMFFLAGAAGVKEKLHMNLDLFVEKLTDTAKRVVHTVVDALLLVFLGFLAIYGTIFSLENLSQLSPALELPMGAINFAIPCGSVLMIVYTIRNMVARFRKEGRNGKC